MDDEQKKREEQDDMLITGASIYWTLTAYPDTVRKLISSLRHTTLPDRHTKE